MHCNLEQVQLCKPPPHLRGTHSHRLTPKGNRRYWPTQESNSHQQLTRRATTGTGRAPTARGKPRRATTDSDDPRKTTTDGR